MNTIQQSLKLLHLEKLLVISKEIDFIENILKYYRGYETKSITVSKATINKLLDDIKSLKSRIQHLEAIYKGEKETIFDIASRVNFILFYDYVKIEIEEMLLVIEALYEKMNQLFGEMLNQYLPYPTFFGRRYSSVGLMMYLDNYYSVMLQKFQSSYNKLVLGWSYNSGFRHKILRNRDIRRENYTYKLYNDYIELPYWYYELPFLIPAITHKVASIALRSKNSIFQEDYIYFQRVIKNFFEDKTNLLVRRVGDILGYQRVVEELARDIFADRVAYKIHGFAYLLTVFHNLLGEDIAKDFLKIEYSNNNQERYSIRENDWVFSLKREHNLLRLALLISFAKEDAYTKQMQKLLDTIMLLDDTRALSRDSFEYYFRQNNPGNVATYNAVKIYMQELFYCIQKHFSSYKEKEYELSCIKDSGSVGIDFKTLWDDRLETITNSNTAVPYKGKFRIEIHRKLSGIEYLEKARVPIKVLTLRKVRKDLINKVYKEKELLEDYFANLIKLSSSDRVSNYIKKIKALEAYTIIKEYVERLDSLEQVKDRNIILWLDKYQKEQAVSLDIKKECTIFYYLKNLKHFSSFFIDNLEKESADSSNITKWIAYGIYDLAYLEEKEQKLDLYKPQNSHLHCSLYYFDSKSILMQVANEIKGEKYKKGNKDKEQGFSLIVNIELKKASSNEEFCTKRAFMTGYHNLQEAINDIRNCLQGYQKSIAQATIYKSLGPKDLTVIIEDASLKVLYSIIQNLNKVAEVNRTFSVFCSQNLNASLQECSVSSYIRVPKNSKLFSNTNSAKAREHFQELSKKGHRISFTTGVMDIKIDWKDKSFQTLNELFDEYKKLIPYMTDYQTKIEQKFKCE